MTDDREPGQEPITIGSPEPPPRADAGAEVERPPARGPQPNGWFAGPPEDPDRYELLGDEISGGEGVLWQARYRGGLESPIPLALKALRRPFDADPGWPTAEDRRRWQDQTALLRHLEVDHMVRLYEVFAGAAPHAAGQAAPGGRLADGPQLAYVVMEWIEGGTLGDAVAGAPADRTTITRRLGYVTHVAEALGSLHSRTRSGGNPTLHRDVKPANCIVHPERGVVLVDLSTMRLLDDGYDPAGLHSPGYAAPEVLAAPNMPRNPACDRYSLGALAAFCLLGEDPPMPVEGSDLRERLVAVAKDARAAEPAALAGLVMAMLDPDPARRPTDTVAWARRLRTAGTPRRDRRTAAVAAASLVVLAGAALTVPRLLGPDSAGPAAPSPPSSASPTVKPVVPVVTPAALIGSAGTIDRPVDGADVKQCSYLSGTASLPDGVTLILAMRNLVNGDPTRYVEYVFGWDEPSPGNTWRGAQYFGQADDSVGQQYAVELIAVERSAAEQAEIIGEDDAFNALPQVGVVLDEVTVHRVKGQGTNHCEGP